ncbi:hypothetical protein NDU88_003990 [Pleurodeles waltl]|uniref:Uncharacterized protein n=1 Tax=Pleurodeles waltl TaxID=8319 RepID=A0AAV7LIL2_PLEWA|nr:hypothetical protein NDU88_003990 [Pleurodeles waltl]
MPDSGRHERGGVVGRAHEGGGQRHKNHNIVQFDTVQSEGVFREEGWDALNNTLTAITNATIFNTDKLDIRIEILQCLATTTMAIDNKLDKLNALIRRAQSHMEADKGLVNQTYQCHCSPILDKLQELPSVMSIIVTDLKQELLQLGNVKQLPQCPQGANSQQKRASIHTAQDAASPVQALGSSVNGPNQEHTITKGPFIPVLSRKNKKHLRKMHNKTVMDPEIKYSHPSSHGNHSSPRGNPRAKQKQFTGKKECAAAAQLGDSKSPTTTGQQLSLLPRSNPPRQQEEERTGQIGHRIMGTFGPTIRIEDSNGLQSNCSGPKTQTQSATPEVTTQLPSMEKSDGSGLNHRSIPSSKTHLKRTSEQEHIKNQLHPDQFEALA